MAVVLQFQGFHQRCQLLKLFCLGGEVVLETGYLFGFAGVLLLVLAELVLKFG